MLAATTPIELDQALATGLASEQCAVEEWPALIDQMAAQSSSLDAGMAGVVAERLKSGNDDEDLAALVRTASRPGLKQRVADYAAAVAAARKR